MPIERPNRDALEAYTDQAIEDTERELEEDRAELARQEALANKPWYESLWDETKNTAEWAYDEAGKAWDFVSATANDVLDAYYKLGAEREAFLKRGADLQQAYSPEAVAEAQETGDYSAQQQAFTSAQEQAAETQTAMTNVPRSFVRQAARTLIETYDDTDDDGALGSLVESIKQSDANIEYFMTDAEKLQKARDIEAATGIKAEAFLGDTKAYKQAMEIYDFKRKLEKAGGDPDKIYEEYPELKSIVDMDPASAAIALHELESIKSTHGTIETFDYMLQQGRLQLEYDNLMYKVAMGKATENDLQRANDLKWQIENSQKKTPSFLDDPLAAIAAGIAGSTPGMYQAIMEGLEDFAITEAAFAQAGAAAGAAVGGVGAAPGAAAGASAGVVKSVIASIAKNSARRELVEAGARQFLTGQVAKSGGSLAFKLGMFSGMQRQMVGESFSDYKDLKDENGNPLLSNEAARNYALASGSAQAGIEMMNFGLIKNALIGRPHANRIIGDIVNDAQSKMVARESARNIFKQKVGDALKITASEAGEEGLQSISDDLVHNQIAADTQAKTVKSYSAQDILTRAAASAAMAIPASIGFGLMGTMGGSVTNTIRNNRAQKKLAQFQALYGDNARQTLVGTLMMEQLQQTVAESKLAKNSPDIQTKVLREQLKQTQFQTSYIDVEMALKKENGMKDLKEVAKAANLSNEELQTAIDQKGHILVPSETLAQVKASPELLDAVSFDAAAPSMARMRETSKEVMQEVEKRTEKAINKQVELINGIVDKYYPTDDKGRQNASQRDMMTAAIYTNINNPAAGWKTLRKEQQDQLDAILAPAIKALEDGFGKAGLGEVEDEQGNKKTVYTSDNDQWYRDWYREHEHKPTKKELQNLAIAMVTGDPSAPKVLGWVPTNAEEQAAFEANRADVEKLKQDIDILDEIKGNMKELTGVEMRLTEGLSAEGYDVYRQVYDYLKKIRGGVAVQARMGALLTARHADIYAAIISKQTGKKYTAMDYMRDTLGFDTKPSEGGLKQMAGVKAQNAPIVDLRRAQEMERNGKTPEEIYDETGWVKGKDGKWRFEIPDDLNKVDWSIFEKGNPDVDYRRLKNIYDNPRLYEAYPWLENKVVHLMDLEKDVHGGVRKDFTGTNIVINKQIGDAERSGALIHEIQHLIQEEEGFASGGNEKTAYNQIIARIRDLSNQIKTYPHGEHYAQALMDQNEMLFSEEKNEQAENAVNNEISDLEKEISLEDREKIWELAVEKSYLQSELQNNDRNDYELYRNLAGEQEARHATERAIAYTNTERAKSKLKKIEQRYEELKANPQDENFKAVETLYKWAKDNLEYRKDESNKVPQPHDENAIIVFDGQEMAMSVHNQQDNIDTFAQTAWHGTPHDFEKFDLGAIGTGEGAQAHGWGLYFAGNREVSEGYKKVLSRGISIDGEYYKTADAGQFVTDSNQVIHEDLGLYRLVKALEESGSIEGTEKYLRQKSKSGLKKVRESADAALALLKEKQVKIDRGKLFEVEIPDNDVLLDEQKPFDEQPKIVQDAIKNIFFGEGPGKDSIDEYIEKMYFENPKPYKKIYDKYVKYKVLDDACKDHSKIDWLQYNKPTQNLPIEKFKTDFAALEKQRDMAKKAYEKGREEFRQEYDEKNAEIDKAHREKFKARREYFENKKDGKGIMAAMSSYLHMNSRQISEALNKYGVKGITYEGGRDGRCFVVFDDKAISVIERYNQMVAEKNQDETLGFTNFYQDGRRIVSILENANESTFVHELGHVFLDDLQKLAKIDDTSAKELEIVNAWAEWHKGDAEKYRPTSPREKNWYKEFKQREQAIIDAEAAGDYDAADKLKREWKHERFARAFELYLRDGQAPAKGLKEVFRKFKVFLKQVYMIFTADGARASEPVKRVMDRMIASEEEIEQASLEDRYKDITAAGGSKLLEETEEKTYKRFYKEAEAESKEKLMAIVMDDLEDARKAELDRRIMSEEARKRKELQQETVYLAEQAVLLSGGNEDIVSEWYPSVEAFRKELAETKPLEDALKEWMDKYKDELDAELIESHFSEENIEKCMQKPKYREKMEVLKATALTKKLSLINSINAKAKTAIGSIEDKLMAMPDDIDLKVDKSSDSVKAIMKAINELRFAARWTPNEYRHIESMIRANTQEDIRQALKAFKEQAKENKENEQAVLKANEGKMQLYKELAKSSIVKKNLADACNYGYYVREQKIQARRVQQMINAKRFDMAIQAQQQQAFAAAMANESKKMQERVQKLLNTVKRQLNTRSVRLPKDERYWHRHLSYILRLTNTDAKKPESGVMKLEDIFSSMKESLDLQYSPIDIMEISAEDEDFKGYKSLTFDQFEDAVEALTVLYTTGRDKFRMKTIGGRDIADVVQEIILGSGIKDRVRTTRDIINDDKGGLGYNGWLGKIPGIGQAMAERGQKYLAVMLKPEEILKALGPAAHKYIFGIYDKAREAENKMIMEEMRVMRDILKNYSDAEKRAWKKKNIKFRTGQTERLISKENVICMALNMGNKANIQRICGGFGTSLEEVEPFLAENMTKKDWELVQNIWDHLESYWQKTVEVEEKLTGVALQKVEAVPFTAKTKDGEEIKLNGGYYPIKYNPKKSSKAEEQDINQAAMGMMSGWQVLATNLGFVKGRADVDINRPILLEFSVITEHLQNVIHNINYRIPARDVYRLVNSQAFEDHVRNTLGAPYHTLLKQWATDVWNQPKDQSNMAGSFADELLGFLRRNAVISIMGYRLWPVIENISNIAPAMDQLGATKALAAISKFYANYEDSKGILKKSIFMMNRINSMDRDISAQEGLFEVGLPVFDIIKRHAYDMMLYSDLMISAPLWVQSYKDAFPVKVDEVRRETQANIKALHDAQMEVDEIKAAINDAEKEAAEIDNHMSIRESGTPEQIEQEKLSPFALHKPVELRAMSHERRNQAFEKRKELYKAEDKLNRAMELDIYSDDELIKEAERRAVAAADAVIRDTFGSGATMDLSSLQRNKNEMVKLMTTFYSFFNTQFNAIYRDYTRGKFGPEEINAIRRWAPFAKKIMYRIVLVSLIGSLLKFALGVDGNDDKDKYITVKDANGKEKKVEVPAFQRFLNVFGKNMLSTAAGGLVGVRDAANMAINYLFDGTNYGRSFNPVSAGFRSVEEFGKMFDLIARKGKKDLEIQEQEEKREREWKERLKKLKGKKKAAAIKKHEEDEKYRKPVKRITYSEIARHGMTGLSSITASYTGLTSTMVDSITGTMQYLNDTDGRYDPTWKNIIWSALFDKKPVERVVPEKPPAPPKPPKKRRSKRREKNN